MIEVWGLGKNKSPIPNSKSLIGHLSPIGDFHFGSLPVLPVVVTVVTVVYRSCTRRDSTLLHCHCIVVVVTITLAFPGETRVGLAVEKCQVCVDPSVAGGWPTNGLVSGSVRCHKQSTNVGATKTLLCL